MQAQYVAQPAEPEDQTGVLVALCGLGALLGFGATRYRAALAVAGKRAEVGCREVERFQDPHSVQSAESRWQ